MGSAGRASGLSRVGVGWKRALGLQPARRSAPGVQQHQVPASGEPRCSPPCPSVQPSIQVVSIDLPRILPTGHFSSLVLLAAQIPSSSGHPSSGHLPESAGRRSLVKEPGPTPASLSAARRCQSLPLPQDLYTGLALCAASGELSGSCSSQGQVDLQALESASPPEDHPVSSSHCFQPNALWELR